MPLRRAPKPDAERSLVWPFAFAIVALFAVLGALHLAGLFAVG